LDISTVVFDENQLAITANIIVLGSADRMLQLLADEPTKELFGPFEASEANVRTTKCRSMAYIPYDLIDSLLGANVTARQANELIVPVLVDAGLADVCEPLIEFLTIALVEPNATRSTPLTVQTLVGVWGYIPSPAAIIFRRQSIMYRDLPGLRPTTTYGPGDPAMLNIARSVRDFVSYASTDRTDRALAREESRRPKTVRERMSDAITDRLLLL
jgi:hypothetical protein